MLIRRHCHCWSNVFLTVTSTDSSVGTSLSKSLANNMRYSKTSFHFFGQTVFETMSQHQNKIFIHSNKCHGGILPPHPSSLEREIINRFIHQQLQKIPSSFVKAAQKVERAWARDPRLQHKFKTRSKKAHG